MNGCFLEISSQTYLLTVCSIIVYLLILIKMKIKNNSSKAEKDKKQQLLENQNIHDFNPSQFTENDDVDKKKKKQKGDRKKEKGEK